MTERVEAIVIGAGIIGLAIARQLALSGREVVIIEAADKIGTQTSSHNSEVIHAGIYYPTDSLKARLCVSGRQALYAYCAENGIEHKKLGKIIVATAPEQIEKLSDIKAQAEANGVDDLTFLNKNELKVMEPELKAEAGLLSPSTGIIDSHGLMLSYLGEAQAHGAVLAVNSPVISGEVIERGIRLQIGTETPYFLESGIVVNAAGLGAQKIAQSIDGVPPGSIPPLYLAKGNYFKLQGRAPFSRLIYPVPEPGGLGIHLTLDLGGQARFGPDVEWVDEIDYGVDPARGDKFYEAISTYYPALKEGALTPDYAGFRPKISGPGEAVADFAILGPRDHGVTGLINLFGIESPGLTASLAIAEYATGLLD